MKKSKIIAIIGRVPPPYGGVTVHLNRLLDRLLSESIEYDFYDLGGMSNPNRRIYPGKGHWLWLLYFLLRARQRYRLLHFHSSNPYTLIAAEILMTGSNVKLVYSLHGKGLYCWATKTGPWFLRWLLRRALRRADRLFPINPSVAQKLPHMGIDPNRISWMAAYLPPSTEDYDLKHLSSRTLDFIETHDPIIGMQAWFGSFQEGQEVYGLEVMFPLLKGLQKRFPHIGLCTVISGTLCTAHRQQIFALRAAYDLKNHWLIIEENGPAIALFRCCDIFIRPTTSDGDSLSVRECLSLGIPVIASDAVIRPKGCILFPLGNTKILIETVITCLESKATDSYNNYSNSEDQDHARCLLDYYHSVSSGPECKI